MSFKLTEKVELENFIKELTILSAYEKIFSFLFRVTTTFLVVFSQATV